jgi:hypothetical protein
MEVEITSPAATKNPPPTTTNIFHAWTAEEFLSRELPAKEPLLDGLLFRRDMIALAGRRRHGKTNFILNLAVALSTGAHEFLGYPLTDKYKVLIFFLEDDTREIQDKLQHIIRDNEVGARLALLTREDFLQANIPIQLEGKKFREAVLAECENHQPDLVIFDNLAQMIGADYNNSQRIHVLASFCYELTNKFNAAVLVAAHPRKRSNDNNAIHSSLRSDSEEFFEDVMGSSHFVNSFGSLWGLERDLNTDRTVFLGGAQRVTGQQSITTFEVSEEGGISIISDFDENLRMALNTEKREAAWHLLPNHPFTYLEAVEAVKPRMSSQSTFYAWWKDYLIRLKLIKPYKDNRYIKANIGGNLGDVVEVGSNYM